MSVTILTTKAVITAVISRISENAYCSCSESWAEANYFFQLSFLAALPTLDVLLPGVSLVLRLSRCLREAQPVLESQRLEFRGLRDPLEEAL